MSTFWLLYLGLAGVGNFATCPLFITLGSPGTNLAGSSNLAGSLPHELVINLGKVESNMAGIL